MKKEKVSRGWRTLAIILLILSVSMIILTIISIHQNTQQVKNTNICYYDICSDYPDAYYENDVCTCYDYDVLGNEQVAYTEYMGKR
ncbi:MAG TPA: hypothetical protein ENG87_01555 [Candidatus Pacearchaeota archaeon]|nr:hypothetical protein [Candidatus Pacearchaeota archaeon]